MPLTAITITADGPTRFEASRLVTKTAYEVLERPDHFVKYVLDHNHQVPAENRSLSSEVAIALAGPQESRSQAAAALVAELQYLAPYYGLTFAVDHQAISRSSKAFGDRSPVRAQVKGLAG